MRRIERLFEGVLFASRWAMAPLYLGLAAALLLLVVKFLQELAHAATHVLEMSESELLVAVLTLIDLSLVGNLLLLVLFAGYENFVSKLNIGDHHDRPEWMGKVDYSGMKLKLVASIVAIAAIQLLRAMMNISAWDTPQLAWMVGIQLTFVVSGVLLALTERLTESSEGHGKDPHIPEGTQVAEGTVVEPGEDPEEERDSREKDSGDEAESGRSNAKA